MRKSKFTESQIMAALKQAEAGVPVNEVARQMGISPALFYRWRAKYGGA
jgi:putative transposase